ncbi:MAG: hypothetical protein ACJ760_00205 [Thermoleophilaceae bacterium]
MRITRLTAIAAALATVAALGVIGVSAASAATIKFGAKLTSNTQPSNANNQTCADADPTLSANPCTRVPTTFADVGAINGAITAPKTGTVTKIKLIAQKPGSMVPFVVALKNINAQTYTAKGKATAKGPKISYVSSIQPTSYKVQSFAVNIPVHKGEYLGITAKRTSMLRCNSGGGKQLLFAPPLKIGNPFDPSDGRDDCVLLIQGVIHY